jgi:Cu(I)/Ag(I) efflux system membrane fusion protein
MSRAVIIVTAVAALAAGGGWLWYGKREAMPVTAMQETAEKPLYYRDPDGKPSYSAKPMKTTDGREYIAVMKDEVTFAATDTPAPSGKGKVKFYRNPMGLPDTSPVPKKDSMGMDYIAVFENEAADDGAVRVSPGKIQRTGVKSEPAEMRVIRSVLRAPGSIQLDERRISIVAMRADSFIQKVSDVTTGTRVSKGETLMEIYSPAISSAAAEFVATKSFPGNDNLNSGVRQRLKNFDLPESVMATIEKGQRAPLVINWTAPRDGIVLERKAVEGMRVQAGEMLFKLADVGVVWALADVAERDLALLKVGQVAQVTARGYPGRTFEGKVTVIYPQVSKETRTVRVRIELANEDSALLPDMYVDAEINVGNPGPVLAVPDNAVLDSGSRQVVFIDKGEGKLEPRDVKVGTRAGGFVEIREGIADGDVVVTSANFLIDAESNLNAALKGFAQGGQP